MNDQEKMLKLMRFWLFGTFLIVFVAALIFVGGAMGTGLLLLKQPMFWVAFLVVAVLCVAWYYIYKWYLGRKK
jgi:magnesium-transporting ATPase (P-type)